MKVERPHVCPVVYLRNFAHISSRFFGLKRNHPKRSDYHVYMHDKIVNTNLKSISVDNLGVRRKFYTDLAEERLQEIEGSVGVEFRKIRNDIYTNPNYFSNVGVINVKPIYDFVVTQMIRTPKFRKELMLDGNTFKNLSQKDYDNSLWGLTGAIKPTEINIKWLMEIQEGLIRSNRLFEMFNWSKLILVNNQTKTDFITCDHPAAHKGFRFVPTYVNKTKRLEPFLLLRRGISKIIFPINRSIAILIHNFDNNRKSPLIKVEFIRDRNSIMRLNELFYLNAERQIYTETKNNNLISEIRDRLKGQINLETMKWYDNEGEQILPH